MPHNSIAIIPTNGYNPQQKSSQKAFFWLKFQSEKLKIEIQTNRSIDGEKKIGRYYVDGINEDKKIIFEFHGCYWHGCQLCYTAETFNSDRQMTLSKAHLRHQDRIKYLKETMFDYEFIEIWEHTYDFNVKNCKEYMLFFESNTIVQPLVPRNALYGGRTNAIKLYHKAEKDETIQYYDFTSLYPFVQMYAKFPIDHPQIITSNFQQVENYFGLIYCVVLPPKNLFLPVLPFHSNNKLVFALCGLCSEIKNTDKCNHTDKQRSITGTWVSEEVKKAIEFGYKVTEIIEVWHFEKTVQYNKETNELSLFGAYHINTLKEKVEASGYPDNCNTDIAKEQYIKDFYINQGIELDRNKIEFNQGRRCVAKIKANSQWGYVAMNNNKTQFKIIHATDEWFNLISNKKYEILSVVPVNKKKNSRNPTYLQVQFKVRDEFAIFGKHLST